MASGLAVLTQKNAHKAVYQLLRLIMGPIIRRQVSVEVLGLDHLPQEGAAIVVGNHRSDMDATLVSAVLPRYVAWVVADYMQQVFPTSAILRLTGMVPMNVEGQVSLASMKQAIATLEQGNLLGIFPEGESYIFANDFEAPLANFSPGFAAIALKAQVPIIPMMICPLQETLVPITIPPQIRDYLSARHDLSQIQQIARYQTIQIVIGAPILPPDNSSFRSRREKLQLLQAQTRNAMGALQSDLCTTKIHP